VVTSLASVRSARSSPSTAIVSSRSRAAIRAISSPTDAMSPRPSRRCPSAAASPERNASVGGCPHGTGSSSAASDGRARASELPVASICDERTPDFEGGAGRGRSPRVGTRYPAPRRASATLAIRSRADPKADRPTTLGLTSATSCREVGSLASRHGSRAYKSGGWCRNWPPAADLVEPRAVSEPHVQPHLLSGSLDDPS